MEFADQCLWRIDKSVVLRLLCLELILMESLPAAASVDHYRHLTGMQNPFHITYFSTPLKVFQMRELLMRFVWIIIFNSSFTPKHSSATARFPSSSWIVAAHCADKMCINRTQEECCCRSRKSINRSSSSAITAESKYDTESGPRPRQWRCNEVTLVSQEQQQQR